MQMQLMGKPADVRFGSLADKPSQTKIRLTSDSRFALVCIFALACWVVFERWAPEK
jgi:hypothetical protein